MELSQLVTSLETSKRLKELGVEQISMFTWFDTLPFEDNRKWWLFYEQNTTGVWASAFTSSELWEMLPHRIRKDGLAYDLEFWKSHDKKIGTCYIDMESEHKFLISYEDNNEAESRWKLYIYLKENNLIWKY